VYEPKKLGTLLQGRQCTGAQLLPTSARRHDRQRSRCFGELYRPVIAAAIRYDDQIRAVCE
jgi:hypothetical protein